MPERPITQGLYGNAVVLQPVDLSQQMIEQGKIKYAQAQLGAEKQKTEEEALMKEFKGDYETWKIDQSNIVDATNQVKNEVMAEWGKNRGKIDPVKMQEYRNKMSFLQGLAEISKQQRDHYDKQDANLMGDADKKFDHDGSNLKKTEYSKFTYDQLPQEDKNKIDMQIAKYGMDNMPNIKNILAREYSGKQDWLTSKIQPFDITADIHKNWGSYTGGEYEGAGKIVSEGGKDWLETITGKNVDKGIVEKRMKTLWGNPAYQQEIVRRRKTDPDNDPKLSDYEYYLKTQTPEFSTKVTRQYQAVGEGAGDWTKNFNVGKTQVPQIGSPTHPVPQGQSVTHAGVFPINRTERKISIGSGSRMFQTNEAGTTVTPIKKTDIFQDKTVIPEHLLYRSFYGEGAAMYATYTMPEVSYHKADGTLAYYPAQYIMVKMTPKNEADILASFKISKKQWYDGGMRNAVYEESKGTDLEYPGNQTAPSTTTKKQPRPY